MAPHARARGDRGAGALITTCGYGRCRAAKLSPEQRSETARTAAMARWDAAEEGAISATRMPKATHSGTLPLGGNELSCAVLEDGRRVLSEGGFFRAIGRSGNPYVRGGREHFDMPPFLSAANLQPYISDELRSSSRPIAFRAKSGGGHEGRAWGYPAELLPQVCTVFLEARDAGVLLPGQEHIAKACDLLIRGLARVGIVALVDEATGYQVERNRYELQRILEAYTRAEFLKWTRRFPPEFYEEMFRLRGWKFDALAAPRGPRFAGTLTNQLVYERLPPGVLDELRRLTPANEKGQRPRKHFQHLTNDIGHRHLEMHVAAIITLMRASPDWKTFDTLFMRAFPAKGDQLSLPGATIQEPADE